MAIIYKPSETKIVFRGKNKDFGKFLQTLSQVYIAKYTSLIEIGPIIVVKD